MHGREIVTASDGTFVIQFNGGIKPTGSTTSEVNGRFVLKKGTGAYSKLHSTGKIHATLDSASGSITAVDRERRTSTAVARRGGAAAAPLHGTRWIPRAHNTFAGGSRPRAVAAGGGAIGPADQWVDPLLRLRRRARRRGTARRRPRMIRRLTRRSLTETLLVRIRSSYRHSQGALAQRAIGG